jgi:hypothetical protein
MQRGASGASLRALLPDRCAGISLNVCSRKDEWLVWVELGLSGHRSNLNPVPIDGRPRFAKRSLDDGEKVKMAAIDPDFA